VDHSTLNRWVLAYAPLVERRLHPFAMVRRAEAFQCIVPCWQAMRRLSRRNSRCIADTTSSADRNATVLTSYLPNATPAAGVPLRFSHCAENGVVSFFGTATFCSFT
jgi:hypothetical protein